MQSRATCRGRAAKPRPQPPPHTLPELCRHLDCIPHLSLHPSSLPAPLISPCPPLPPTEPGPFTWHLIYPTPALLRGYLQGMVYGSSVGDQLIKRGSIEMLPKGHQSHQLVCRNLGESDKSLPAGTCMPRFGHVPHGTVTPRRRPGPAAQRFPARLSRCSRGCWAAAASPRWGFVCTVQPREEGQRQRCRGRPAAEGGRQRRWHCTHD